jgi:hypothetical protein
MYLYTKIYLDTCKFKLTHITYFGTEVVLDFGNKYYMWMNACPRSYCDKSSFLTSRFLLTVKGGQKRCHGLIVLGLVQLFVLNYKHEAKK